MNEELLKKIRSDLEKSGMHSELVARNAFLNEGWRLTGAGTYFDRDEGKSREIDVSAYYPSLQYLGEKVASSNFFHVYAEVKKSERPWVVFRRTPPKWGQYCAWNNLIGYNNLPCPAKDLTDYLREHSLIRLNGWEGIGIHESFKNPDQPSRWYGAFVGACKAADAYHHKYCKREEESSDISVDAAELSFHQPVVILDGELVSAELADNGDIHLEPIRSAAFKFGYETEAYTAGPYRVDLVTLSFLPEYLRNLQARQRRIDEGIRIKSGLNLVQERR
jgi:hypothetical protein